jgi:hypothetical protein
MFQVRSAVMERLRSIQGMGVLRTIPDYIEAPLLVVVPGWPPSNTELAFNSSYAEWNLMLDLFVDRIDEDEAQDELGQWLDTAGPIIRALRSEDIDDSLGRMTKDVRIPMLGDFDEFTNRGTIYWYAQIKVKVKA